MRPSPGAVLLALSGCVGWLPVLYPLGEAQAALELAQRAGTAGERRAARAAAFREFMAGHEGPLGPDSAVRW